jgi:hypothetical protein
MRKSKFTDEQVVAILRRGDRDPMVVVAMRHGERADDLLLVPSLGAPSTFRSSPVMASGRMYIQGTRKRLRL